MTGKTHKDIAALLGLLLLALTLGPGMSSCKDRATEQGEAAGIEAAADKTRSLIAEAAAATGLTPGEGVELVLANCITCHGPKQFLQQRADRDTWLGIIRWMQRDHGLWEFTPDVETGILDYLETHYGVPERGGRRPALRDELLPPNPYAGNATAESGGGSGNK